jgi:hypothetical protein
LAVAAVAVEPLSITRGASRYPVDPIEVKTRVQKLGSIELVQIEPVVSGTV